MLSQPDFWVGVSFVLFVAVLLYLKAPAFVAKALDNRAAAIEAKLAHAQSLREEAQQLLADCERKYKHAEDEAKAIIAQAQADAEAYARESRENLAAVIKRRDRAAREKIARAEAAAIKSLRDDAADLAVTAAANIIAGRVTKTEAGRLIDDGINVVANRLG